MGGETGCGWPESPGPREAPSRSRSDSNEGQDVFLELLPGKITTDRIAHCTFLHQCSRCDRWRHSVAQDSAATRVNLRSHTKPAKYIWRPVPCRSSFPQIHLQTGQQAHIAWCTANTFLRNAL